MTLASNALRIWQDKYWNREVRRPPLEVWSLALEAYHGGRTQAFAVGEHGPVSVVDVASMFPWAMVTKPLPLPWGVYRRVAPGEPILPNGIYTVAVHSEIERPRLPVRTVRGTIYPNGRWTGAYVGEELLAFQGVGGKCRVTGGFVFGESCEPFTEYVSDFFTLKQNARGLDRTLFKLLLNSLYGKFGQKGKQIRVTTLEKFLAMETRPLVAREWNGLIIYSVDGTPPPWSNNVWPAFVTARARVKLADELDAVARAGARPLYCDTDSIIFSGSGGRYPVRAPKIGDFELRGRFKRVLLVGKKEYALDHGRGVWESHAKGIPEAERMRYLREGVAEFDRPLRLRESARVGGSVNVWRRVRKERRVTVGTSAIGVDGALAVARIGDRLKSPSKRGK
jgi:hypothetical protein